MEAGFDFYFYFFFRNSPISSELTRLVDNGGTLIHDC